MSIIEYLHLTMPAFATELTRERLGFFGHIAELETKLAKAEARIAELENQGPAAALERGKED